MQMYPPDRQADALKKGLKCLPADFVAHICGACDGAGKYEQTYTAGCGQGYYSSAGMCDWCSGYGLVYDSFKPAPQSVINQVIEAGKKGEDNAG